MPRFSSKAERKIYDILRDCCDSPRVLFHTAHALYLRRPDGVNKHVLLVSTRLFTYLIKAKDTKLYMRWPNCHLSVCASRSTVTLTTRVPIETLRAYLVDHDGTRADAADDSGNPDKATRRNRTACAPSVAERVRSRAARLFRLDSRDGAAGRIAASDLTEYAPGVTLQTTSSAYATLIEGGLATLVQSAQHTAALGAAEEAGELVELPGRRRDAHTSHTMKRGNRTNAQDCPEHAFHGSDDATNHPRGYSLCGGGGDTSTNHRHTCCAVHPTDDADRARHDVGSNDTRNSSREEAHSVLVSSSRESTSDAPDPDDEGAPSHVHRHHEEDVVSEAADADAARMARWCGGGGGEEEEEEEDEDGHAEPPPLPRAVRQCAALAAAASADAAAIAPALTAAAAAVRRAVLPMREAACAVRRWRVRCANLARVRELLRRSRDVVDAWEAAEGQVVRGQTMAAMQSLHALVRAANRAAGGEEDGAATGWNLVLTRYVMSVRLPALRREIVRQARRQWHLWLQQLREAGSLVGRAALRWRGGVRVGRMTRCVRMRVDETSDDEWVVTQRFVGARVCDSAVMAESAVVRRISNGAASVQTVFALLRRERWMRGRYAAVRGRQYALDIFEPPVGHSVRRSEQRPDDEPTSRVHEDAPKDDGEEKKKKKEEEEEEKRRQQQTEAAWGAPGDRTAAASSAVPPSSPRRADDSYEARVVRRFTAYCATALGFILMEDVVYHATAPPLLSRTTLLQLWHRVSCRIADHARAAAQAMLGSESYAMYTIEIFRAVRGVVRRAVQNVRSVELSPLVLSRSIESMSDSLVSWWLQAACVDCTQHILRGADADEPPVVNSEEEFAEKVSRFSLHRCARLELPVPTRYRGGRVSLPFCAWVPLVGGSVLSFLAHCYRVMELDGTSVVQQSELNNTDDLLLKYISVLFRTVSETLQSRLRTTAPESVLSYALLVTSCACMPVLVSCAEQRFMVNSVAANDEEEEEHRDMPRRRALPTWSSGVDRVVARQQLGKPHLLASTAAFFSPVIQNAIELLLQAMTRALEDRLRVTADILYWLEHVLRREQSSSAQAQPPSPPPQQTPLHEPNSGAGSILRPDDAATATMDRAGQLEQTAFAWAMRDITEMLPRLNDILQRSVIYSVVGTVMTHAGMLMQSNIETAIRDAAKDGSSLTHYMDAIRSAESRGGGGGGGGDGRNRSMFDLLRACVQEFKIQCEVLIPRWQATLMHTLPDLTAVRRFPLQVESTVEDLMLWLESRKRQLSG